MPYVESYKKALRLLIADKKPVEARAVMTQEALPDLLKYHAAWNDYARYQNDQIDQAQSIAGSNYVQTRIEAIALISLAFFLSVGIAFLVTRNLTKHMTRRKVAEAGLRQARDELETRVLERTSQLAMANEDLRKEIDAR